MRFNNQLISDQKVDRMSFYRSDSMSSFKLYLPRQSAWEIMNKLGRQQIIHVVSNNSSLVNREFIGQIKRCDDALKRIQDLQSILKVKNIYEARTQFSQEAYRQIYQLWAKQIQKSSANPANLLNDVIGQINNDWSFHDELTKRYEILSQKMAFYRQNIAIIKAGEAKFGKDFFTQQDVRRSSGLGRGLVNSSRMHFKCGILTVQQQLRFQKTVFRITKGNCLMSCVPFTQLLPNIIEEQRKKMVFFVLFPGKQQSFLDRKLTKLIQNFNNNKFQLPNHQNSYDSIVGKLQYGCEQTQKLLTLTQETIQSFLNKITQPLAQSSFFRKYQYRKLYVLKQKELYNNLNEMQVFNNFLQAKIYIKSDEVESVQRMLSQLDSSINLPTGYLVPSQSSKYPTHFVKNDFTRTAQQIVQTYGVATYKQANPGFFTVITFPFLFGVMFADIAHGALLFAFGLYLIFNKDKIMSPLLKMIIPHRYMFALMGFFSIFCGFIFNDYLSLDLDLFGSCYPINDLEPGSVIPRSSPDCVYPFGLDPVWFVSVDYLKYVNSLKMKISVIIAVVHMTLGVFIKASNTLYHCQMIDFFFSFIPQLIFLLLLFGYMDFLIIYKWNVDWDYSNVPPPSVITTMINMPLKMGKTTDCCGGQPMWGEIGNTSQNEIQTILLVVAILAVPLMLIPKPVYVIYCQSKRKKSIDLNQQMAEQEQKSNRLIGSFDGSEEHIKAHNDHSHDSHGGDEIVVHQLIQTIEYVLGCISNTASYLRLWALSLAHSQLSQVFFQYLVQSGIQAGYSGIPLQIIGFVLLAGITFGVLLCMDSMECFLHTLRLHWVQFQNKFYKGEGFAFVGYSFTNKINAQLSIV